MQLSLLNNPSATSASHNLSKAMDAHRRSLARLSSGNRIVNPADDAGGLAVGNKLDSKLSRLEKVHQNLKNTISFTELQESALRTVGVIITRMSELKTMSTDVTKNSADIENYNKEFVELQKQIEAMTKHKFNGVSLFSNTSKFAETDADGRSGNGVDLARNFVFDEYVAQSGAVLGQGTTTTTSAPGTGGSGGGTGSTAYTIAQWQSDYNFWINYDDSNWDNDYNTWKLSPAQYGGIDVLDDIKSARGGSPPGITPPSFEDENIQDLTPVAGWPTTIDWFFLYRNQISDLSPLARLQNLDDLLLQFNQISDLKPLAGLTNLTRLSLLSNQIEDLEPLANLTNLETLRLDSNNITNISALSGLTNLQDLNLGSNNVSDLTPLSGLTNLVDLDLSDNPITQSQKDMLESALPTTNIIWPTTILPDPVAQPTTTTTGYPSLDQFTTNDFTNFTQSVASAMAEVGSHQSRLNMEVRQNESARVNLEAAKSRIMDADMAQESSRYAKTNVLVQSSASMVAQANQLSDIALRLIVNR